MNTVSVKTKEPEERDNTSRAVPSPLLANEQKDLTFVKTLMEATRERRLAASQISELSRQVVDGLLHLTEIAAYS